MTVLSHLNDEGITLGSEKCEINKTSMRFLGQLVDKTGVKPDPEKVRAICQMSAPRIVTEVRRFLGMINQLSKFSPHLANLTKPLRDLLNSKNQWCWGCDHGQAFETLKRALISSVPLQCQL